MKEFEEGFQLLKTIKSKWDEGKKLSIDIDSDNACYNYKGTYTYRPISYMLLLDGIDNAVIDDVECMIMNRDSALDALHGKYFYYQCYT